jgi:nucleotide-binding universal stress UspA family protein
VGAFLAGVAITQLIPQLSPLMNRIQFIGNTLFVPFFLISVGMLVDPLILVKEPRSLVVAAAMIGAEVLSKFIAAWACGKIFGFTFPNTMVMFGLSLAQAASTLAAITVAFEIGLVDELTVNGIIAMILVSCVASPWITAQWGQAVKPEAEPTGNRTKQNLGDRVLVPVANPNTEDNLLQLALILAKSSGGTLLPLHVLSDRRGAITPEAKMQQTQLLSVAETIAHGAVTPVESIGRVDDSIDRGIVRTATERNASVIICGWKGYSTYRENLLGSVLDKVVRGATVPVLVSRFAQPLENTERVILAISETDPASLEAQQTAYLAQSMAEELKAPLEVVRVLVSSRQPRLQLAAAGLDPKVPLQRVQGSLAHRIGTITKAGDLLILISETHPERFGQSVLGREPEAIARTQPHLSMLIVHFPTPV